MGCNANSGGQLARPEAYRLIAYVDNPPAPGYNASWRSSGFVEPHWNFISTVPDDRAESRYPPGEVSWGPSQRLVLPFRGDFIFRGAHPLSLSGRRNVLGPRLVHDLRHHPANTATSQDRYTGTPIAPSGPLGVPFGLTWRSYQRWTTPASSSTATTIPAQIPVYVEFPLNLRREESPSSSSSSGSTSTASSLPDLLD